MEEAAWPKHVESSAGGDPRGLLRSAGDAGQPQHRRPQEQLPEDLEVSLELDTRRQDVRQFERNLMPRVVDHFQVYLRELRVEDLRRLGRASAPARGAADAGQRGPADRWSRDVLFKGEMLVQ